MLTSVEASQAILSAMPIFDAESVTLERALGRTLRQSVSAERDQPPFDRVTMDGIAVSFAALRRGLRRFAIQSRQHAGDPRQSLDDDAGCIEIMTGAVMPAGADCVIPVERIGIAGDFAEVEAAYQATRGQFIHPQGSDHRKATALLQTGHAIAAADIAVIASCGLDRIQVARRPSIRVISTGNELVAAGAPIADHQVRMSNGPAVVAMLESHGYDDCRHHHLADDRHQLEVHLARYLGEADVLVLSGGVSMGKADFVPQVLQDLGVRLVFHKISQRPGKPMWFGTGPGAQVVFALPGNPVSTLVCCRQYVLPALAHASGTTPARSTWAVLTKPFSFKPALTCFLPVRLASGSDGRCLATPVVTNTSGDFAALRGTAGYVELAPEQEEFAAGTAWPLHRWTSLG